MTESNIAKPAQRAVRGVMWSYASYYSGKLLIFISTVILARLLTTEDFGVAGYALVVISSLDAMNDLGVGPALIYHRKDPDAVDTAFWLGIGVSLVLFLATFFGAPLVGDFFKDPRAIPITRALSFTFPLAALGHIHDVLLRRELLFGRKFIPDVVKAFGKGVFTVVMALLGLGYWSLILGQLIGEVVAVIALWIVMPWRPSLKFVSKLAKTLLSYGLNIVTINTLSVLLNNASYLLVGRFMGAAALGLYTLAFRLPEMLILQFCSLVSRVIFPYYANLQDDVDGFRRGYVASTRYLMLITFPIGAGLVLTARPLIQIVFGDAWLGSVPIMQAIAVFATMSALAYNAGDVYKAIGRPGLLARLSLLEAVLLLPTLYFAMLTFNSIAAVGWVHAGVALVISVIDIIIACRFLQISYWEIINALKPSLIATGLMSAVVLVVMSQLSEVAMWLQLAVSILLGVSAYLASLMLFERKVMLDGIQVLRTAVAGKKDAYPTSG